MSTTQINLSPKYDPFEGLEGHEPNNSTPGKAENKDPKEPKKPAIPMKYRPYDDYALKLISILLVAAMAVALSLVVFLSIN